MNLLSLLNQNHLELLASYLKQIGAKLPGVVGPAKESEIFAQIWNGLIDKKSKLGMGQKIYKIEKVDIPQAHGSLRLAEPQETDLIGQWLVGGIILFLVRLEQANTELERPLGLCVNRRTGER